MDVNFLLKICGAGIIVAVACRIFKESGREEQSLLLSVAGIIFILIVVIEKTSELIDSIKKVFGL